MRKSDKIKNFKKVNLLTEQRYLQSKNIITESSYYGMDESGLGISGSEIDIEGITDALVATTLHGGDDNTVYLRAKDSLADSNDQVKGEFYTMLADKMEANNLSNQAQQYRSITQQFSNGVEEPKDELDEYDYRRFDQNYGTLEKDRKEKINQFGKDRQATYGIKMKGLNTDSTAFLSPRLSSDIYCWRFKTHRIPNLDDSLSFANKLYAQQQNNGNKPFYTGKDDETYKFFMHQAYDIFDIGLKGDSAFIKGYKDIDYVELEFNLPNTLVNYKTNRGDTNQETKDMLKLVTIGTLVKNNDKINPPFTYKVYGIKTELELIPSSPQDAIKLINIIKETIKNEYKFELNKLFISDVIIEKQAFSKGNFR
jgi:hypothetical protein